ncbi:hypothetical protein FAI40_01580 [Acetobacteraceae bacterium]|nr:hypothetical protein FAI40_01580 [Acetobacteraceae bacterium]
MQRISSQGSVATLPNEPDNGKPGYFTNGNPYAGNGGLDATDVTAAWLNSVQEELCNIVTIMGDQLDPERNDQAVTAIKKYISDYAQSKGFYPYTNDPSKPADETGNTGVDWLGLRIYNGVLHVVVKAGAGANKAVFILPSFDDLKDYQEKGFYVGTYDPSLQPDQNGSVGAGWFGINKKDSIVRLLAKDGAGDTYTAASVEDLGNYQEKGSYVKTNADLTKPDKNGNVGAGWFGLSKNGAGARLLATDDAGDVIVAASLVDLNNYQLKGFYVGTYDPSLQPDQNGSVGARWFGINKKEKIVRLLAKDGAGDTYTAASVEDLDNYQQKGNYPPTLDPSLAADKSGNLGLTLICLNTNKENPQLVVNTGSGDGNKTYAFPSFKDLSNYQPAGNYVPTNPPDAPADESGNLGLGWFGFHTVNGKTNLLAAGGSGSGNLVETIPSFDDLSSYAKLADGIKNKRIESGNSPKSVGANGGTWIAFSQAFGSAPIVVATELNNTSDPTGTLNIWGITTAGFYIDSANASKSFNWIAIGDQ